MKVAGLRLEPPADVSANPPTTGAVVVKSAILGVLIAAIAIGIEKLLWSAFPPSPFLLVYPAVFAAAWYGGWAAGLMATGACALALPYWFLPPIDSFAVAARRDLLDLVIFCVVSVGLIWLITQVKRALLEAHAARRMAERATAAKDTVLAVVAHDLRNPLQTIGLSAQLLQEALEERNDQRALTIVVRIRRAAERAKRLVENILDSARIDATPFPVEMTVSSLSSLVDESLSPFEPLAGARSIQLETPPEQALQGTIICDRDRIVQVLSNVVGNAIKYTPLGGRVFVDVRRSPDGVRFEVGDSGPGMTKEELSHAFDRLWHGSGPGHGSGLGLWISRSLVEAHGGRIDAMCAPGDGTKIMFTLPQPPPTAKGQVRMYPEAAPSPAVMAPAAR